MISFPLSAVLCVYGFDSGWPSVFYIFGIQHNYVFVIVLYKGSIGVLWCILWLLLGFDSPSTHPRISQFERIYIESSIASAEKNEETENVMKTINSRSDKKLIFRFLYLGFKYSHLVQFGL